MPSSVNTIIFSAVVVLATAASGSDVTDVDLACLANYNATLDAEYLMSSKWYEVYQFSGWLNLLPTRWCNENTFSWLTPEELQASKEKYERADAVYNFDDEPMKVEITGYEEDGRILTGYGQYKYSFLKPESRAQLNSRGYNTVAYKKVNDDFLLMVDCQLRSQTLWLWARNQHVTDAELQAVIGTIDEVRYMETRRWCSPI